MKTSKILTAVFPVLLGAIATAAPITLIDPSTALSASVDYRIFVNMGGNQVAGSNPTSAGVFFGIDPANFSHLAFNTNLNDGELLSTASLDLDLQTSGPVGSRIASYFVGVPTAATYNPVFTVNRAPSYTISVTSSLGSNSYVGTGSASGLDILSLVNFASLLDIANTSRNITVTWHDSVDFLVPPNMVKNSSSLPGNNTPKEYRWSVTAGLTGESQLNLDLSVPPPPPVETPEPSSLLLMGSSLALLGTLTRRYRRGLQKN